MKIRLSTITNVNFKHSELKTITTIHKSHLGSMNVIFYVFIDKVIMSEVFKNLRRNAFFKLEVNVKERIFNRILN